MFKKILKIHSPKLPISNIFKISGGIFLALLLIVFLHKFAKFPEIYAPLGASAFLVFAAPSALFAQPANVIFGNIIAAGIAVFFMMLKLDSFFYISLAVALVAFVLLFLRIPHPPAVGFPFMFLIYHPSSLITFASIAFASVLLVLLGIIYHKTTKTEYPIMPTNTIL
jgi:CBS-domain-containing membrane protein